MGKLLWVLFIILLMVVLSGCETAVEREAKREAEYGNFKVISNEGGIIVENLRDRAGSITERTTFCRTNKICLVKLFYSGMRLVYIQRNILAKECYYSKEEASKICEGLVY